MSLLSLSQYECDLWYVFPQELADAPLLPNYHAVMEPEEATQQQRFHFPKDRLTYLVTRAFVRNILSCYEAVEPEDWRFIRNPYGKPFINAPPTTPPLCFNLSHTATCIVCLVARNHDVGIDVENLGRPNPPLEIADHMFAPPERDSLRRLPSSQQPRRFFEFWTLKESYIKARGLGLSLPLDKFWFDLNPDAPPQIHFTHIIRDDPAMWQFSQLVLPLNHIVSIAVRANPEDQLAIRQRCFVPLGKYPL